MKVKYVKIFFKYVIEINDSFFVYFINCDFIDLDIILGDKFNSIDWGL